MGLRFACVLDEHGGCSDLGWKQVDEWQPENGVLWIHLERDDPYAQNWLREHGGIVDRAICDSLIADESRPRVEDYDDALLVVLRGVNRNNTDKILNLVPIRLWVDGNRVISLHDTNHFLLAVRNIREALVRGTGPRSSGELLTKLTEKIIKKLEHVISAIEEESDQLDEMLMHDSNAECRLALNLIRRQAINLRRYLAPQREALFRLQIEDVTWLSKRDKIRLGEATDKVVRYLENLDAVRDQVTILQDDVTAKIAGAQTQASNRLTVVAALFLPPSLLVGLLGVNVGGMPATDQDWAFFGVSAVVLISFPFGIWILRRMKWI